MDYADDSGRIQWRNLGLSPPVLSLQEGQLEVSLHWQESVVPSSLWPWESTPVGTLWVATANPGSVDANPITGPLRGVHLGTSRIICGTLPAGAVSVVALARKVDRLTLHVAAGTFMTKVSLRTDLHLSFRDAKGRVVTEQWVPEIPPRTGWPTRMVWWLQGLGWLPVAKGSVMYTTGGKKTWHERRHRQR